MKAVYQLVNIMGGSPVFPLSVTMSIAGPDITAGDRSPRQNIEVVKNDSKELVVKTTLGMGGYRRTVPNTTEWV